MKMAASAACRIVEKNAAATIQTMTSASQSGDRNSASVETTSPSAPAKPSRPLATNMATRIASR